jgi:adenosylmethionine-8-amino-7-oxononanoate aminotransferase
MTDRTATQTVTPQASTILGGALWSSQASMRDVLHDRIVIDRAEGAHVFDREQRRLLDVGSGLWHCNVGHARPEIAEAAKAQILTLETYHTFGRLANRPALELADRLAAIAPLTQTKVFFTSGGSDSVDTAAKLVRRFWVESGKPEKNLIVTREGGYHGMHAYGTSLAGIDVNRQGYGSPSLVPDTARVPTNELAPLTKLLEEQGEKVAAIFLEAVIGTGGFIPPAPGYLEAVQRMCSANDVLLVLDEVITGFGRTGSLFAAQRYGLEPDIVLVAKGITSGYAPLGAVLVGPRVAEPFWAASEPSIFRHGLTYSGHATACAIAHTNLDILERENLVERVAKLEPVLADSLHALEDHPHVLEVRGPVGFMAGVQLVDADTAERAARAALGHGLLIRAVTNGTLGVCPPFVTDLEDLRTLGPRLRAVLTELDG